MTPEEQKCNFCGSSPAYAEIHICQMTQFPLCINFKFHIFWSGMNKEVFMCKSCGEKKLVSLFKKHYNL
jgi:hypothetical protein